MNKINKSQRGTLNVYNIHSAMLNNGLLVFITLLWTSENRPGL